MDRAWKSFFTSLYGKDNYSIFLVNHYAGWRLRSILNKVKGYYFNGKYAMDRHLPEKRGVPPILAERLCPL
jgi:hypothetical protein